MVITGSPGVGKHAISDGVARMLGREIIDINKVALGMDSEGVEDGSKIFDAKKLGGILRPLIGASSLVVGHLAPYVLESSQIEKMAVLRRSPYELGDIYKKRGYSDSKTQENIEAEILGIIMYDSLRLAGNAAVQVDITGMSVDDAVIRTAGALSGGDGDEVDWLGTIAGNADLQAFFSDG